MDYLKTFAMELNDKFKKCLKKLKDKKKQVEFEFLEEKAINNNLLFGHEKIVDTLRDVVTKSPQSFTVGLYGDWGTGKSTIISSLKKELEKDKIPLILFDVWKHEGDALRRTFLNTVVNDLKIEFGAKYFKEDFKIDDRNFNSKSITEDFQSIFLKKALLHFSLISLLTVIVVFPFFIIWLLMKTFLDWDLTESSTSKIIGSLFSLSILPIFYKYINQFIKVKKVTKLQDRFKDPHEFEDEFKRILKDGFLKNKLVIAFDNLDRVSGEKAIEIISTIKTFLDPIDEEVKDKDIVFIIPCDERAIKRHLQKTLNYSHDFKGEEYYKYAGEYLRKFFNTIVWIPDFYINELEDYATNSLKATKIKDFINEELAALIVWVFDENPRQIIQFINVLISNYTLIKNRPIEGFDLTKDIAQLAKYLLLIQKFPDIMDIYRKTLSYDLKDSPNQLRDEIDGKRKFSDIRLSEFHRFLNLTEHIKIESLDIFFKLRRSKFEVELGNKSVKLLKLLETNRIKEIIKIENEDKEDVVLHEDLKFLNDINLKGKEDALSEIINERLRVSKNSVVISKFIDGVLYFSNYKKIELNDKVYRMMYKKLNQHANNISDITPKLLTEVCYKKMKNNSDKSGLRDIVNKNHIEDFIYAHEKNE